MTDAEIKKALECCKDELHWCATCPYFLLDKENDLCREDLCDDALYLINRQQAEIETLRVNVKASKRIIQRLKERILMSKTEAVKEFAEAYKDQIKNYTGMFTDEGFYVSLDAVLSAVDFVLNKTLEEMVGEGQ
jgi:hypothetical protein